jgi:DNA modification methylase
MTLCAAQRISVPVSVLEAIANQNRVDEPPHNFYKYPARFSPRFAREVIKGFTNRGDTVIDPFCGGGTSLVEAIILGRKAAGFDISSLAVFLATAKTSAISVHDKREIFSWLETLKLDVGHKVLARSESAAEDYYRRNLPESSKRFLGAVLTSAKALPKARQQKFARLGLLSVGQWALDCKNEEPSWSQLRQRFVDQLTAMVENHFRFLSDVAAANEIPRCRVSRMRRIINRSSEESGRDRRIPRDWLPAKLILTSPPYPGVHVVYHRWQVNGRKETPAPFWLAQGRDGAGEAYYCLGRRSEPELKTYFQRLRKTFLSVRGLIGPHSIVVQLVAFSQPEWQLPTYLRRMEEAGFFELKPVCDHENLIDGRVWRRVPGRRWYAKNRGEIPASREVVLFHRPA